MGVITFDYNTFIAAYPTFANCTSGQLSNCFDTAGLERHQADMEQRLKALGEQAKHALE